MRTPLEQQQLEIEDPLENGDTLYVHLCSGEIVELRPVTAVRVTANSLIALNGKTIVASYPRSRVYFVADEPMEPPSLE